jgi:hypothetical protein
VLLLKEPPVLHDDVHAFLHGRDVVSHLKISFSYALCESLPLRLAGVKQHLVSEPNP